MRGLMTMTTRRRVGLVLVGAAVVSATLVAGCAARGPRNRTQIAALSVGELALELSRQEREVYAAGVPGYDKANHDRVGLAITKVLYAVRAFERAAAAWPDGVPAPAAVEAARAGVNTALNDLVRIVPPLEAVRGPLNRAAAAIRAALAEPQARHDPGDVHLAQLPSGGLLAFMALLNVLVSLIDSGKTTYLKVKGFLAQEGATPEQLAALDAALSTEIAQREAEHGAGG